MLFFSVLSNFVMFALIFRKLTKSPSSSFDDVDLNCDEVNVSEMLLDNLEQIKLNYVRIRRG